MATYDLLCGFEVGHFGSAGPYGYAGGTPATSGTPTIQAVTARTAGRGVRAMKCDRSGATAKYVQFDQSGTSNGFVCRFYLNVDALPATTETVFQILSTSTSRAIVQITPTGAVSIACTGTAQTSAAGVIAINRWYLIEVKFDCSANPWRLDCKVTDDAAVPTTMTQATSAVAANTFGRVRFGGVGGVTNTWNLYYDDIACSSTLADYPIGNGSCKLFQIDTPDGSHNTGAAGDFKNDAGTNITNATTDANQKLIETPGSVDTTTWLRHLAGASTEYMQFAFVNTSGQPAPRGVFAVCGWTASATSGNNSTTRINDGGSMSNIKSGGQATTGLVFYGVVSNTKPSGGAWTNGAIDSLLLEHGFATTFTSFIRLTWAAIEVEYPDTITDNESFSGSVSPAGALARETDKSEGGTITPSGSIVRTYDQNEAGSIAPVGTLGLSPQPKFAGTLTPAGALSTTPVQKTFTGTLGLSGSLGITVTQGAFAGALTPRGGSPYINPAGATVDPYGTIIKEIDTFFRGKCTPTVIGRVGGGGLPGDPGDTGSPGPGDGTGGTGGGGTVLVDCPCIVHLDVAGGLTVVVGRAVTTGPRARNLLGCGTYQVFATTRGGRSIIVEIPYTSLEWGRVLSDTSTASITAQGVSGISDACARGLAVLRPRKHEIAVYRSSYLVWAGPISGPLKVEGDTLTIPAADLSSWFDRRRIRRTITLTADLSDVFAAYVDAAMESDPSPQLLIEGGQSGVIGTRSVLAAAHELAGPLIRELAEAGVAWTVERRTLHYGRPVTPSLPIALLIDDSYVAQPDVEIIDIGANDLIVAGQGTGEAGDTIYGYARDAASQSEYGLLDAVYRESLILDATSAQERAEDDLALVRTPPTVVNGGTLTPFAPVLIDQLIPGVQIDNRLLTSLFPVAGPFQLTKLNVQAGDDGSEQVAVTFQPVASAS